MLLTPLATYRDDDDTRCTLGQKVTIYIFQQLVESGMSSHCFCVCLQGPFYTSLSFTDEITDMDLFVVSCIDPDTQALFNLFVVSSED